MSGNIIAISRIQVGMTKEELAKILEVDVDTITLIELGKKQLTDKQFKLAMVSINRYVKVEEVVEIKKVNKTKSKSKK